LIAVLTAGSAGLLAAVAMWDSAPAAAARAARRGADPQASPSASPSATPTANGDGETVVIGSASPSPTPSTTASGNGDTVVIAPEDDRNNGQNNDNRFRNRFGRPFGSNPHLEFTGWIGWPELTMGCHFDPDFEGADWNGRRVICVDRAVRPPGVGLTRVRGRRCLFPRRRCPFHRFP
jgi:hypothetical protein